MCWLKHLKNFFISVGETAAHSAGNLASAHGLATKKVTPRDFFMFQTVASTEVKKMIIEMPSNKAPGFDKVSILVINKVLSQTTPSQKLGKDQS